MNTVSLVGRLASDAELKEYGDKKVALFTLAVPRQFDREKADFIRCKAWNKTGELIAQYHGKGDRLACVGRIETGKYEDENGRTVFTTDVVVEQITFIQDKHQTEEAPKPKEKQKPIPEGDLPF